MHLRNIILMAAAFATLALAGCAPYQPISVRVTVVGTTSGDGWKASPSAQLVTYDETTDTHLELTITGRAKPVDGRMPTLTARFSADGGLVTCSTSRATTWGTHVRLQCTPSLSPGSISGVTSVALSQPAG